MPKVVNIATRQEHHEPEWTLEATGFNTNPGADKTLRKDGEIVARIWLQSGQWQWFWKDTDKRAEAPTLELAVKRIKERFG